MPTIRGLIDRRLLVNFRVHGDVISRLCPQPFRPKIIDGFGIAGMCLIRLKNIRLKCLPAFLGLSSENAAHRIAVEWDKDGVTRSGVYIPRRDTSSWINAIAGGRIFPGVHNRARFVVQETKDKYQVEMNSLDGSARMLVHGNVVDHLPDDSIFGSIAECSRFFEVGSIGYSPAHSKTSFEGIEFHTENWCLQPIAVTNVESSFFDDRNTFPAGSVSFDNALLMRNIDHEWRNSQPICGKHC